MRPNAPDQSLEHAASRTGAEWVPTAAVLSAPTGNNLFESVRDDGEYPLRWGEYISEGGNPDSYTFGGIPNGTHVVRVDVRDVHGGRATTTLSQNVTVDLPEVQDVLSVARVHDRNDQVAETPAGDEIVTGIVQDGAYIQLDFTETADVTKGLASFLIIERREVNAAGTPLTDPVRFRFRVTPDQDGNFSSYRDYLIRSGVRYQYRVIAVRLPGVQAVSDWRPT